MAMTKTIDPAGWNWDRPIAQMVKVSSRGLIGSDRSDFIKMAGTAAPAFLAAIDGIKLAKDEVPVHTIALGATEFYGPNRNGDGFKEATCRSCHPTFVKYAHWFRNHKNKDPKKSYGYIKLSAYNEGMHRVELLAMLNASKEAAERNHGLVADKELEKLAKDEDISTSMACRVPYDVCSGCQNKAKTRDDYCTEATCKRGGCKHNLSKVAADGHILHVDNPDPAWFDESSVFRGADRIAFGTKADWLQKAASHSFLPGAEMAEHLGIVAPLHVCLAQDEPLHWSDAIRGQVKLANGLAILEQQRDLLPADAYRAFDSQIQGSVSDDQLFLLGMPGTTKSAASLAALADQKIILPLKDFARWVGKQASTDVSAQLLPGIFTHLVQRGQLDNLLSTNPFAASFDKTASLAVRALASNLSDDFSMTADAVTTRAMRSGLRKTAAPNIKAGFENVKQASDHSEGMELAREYALYKLAALHRIASLPDVDFVLTARLAVGQNRV